MAFPISEGILPHSIGPEVVAVPIIIASSVGYVYHQKKINNLQAKLQQNATKKQWDLYEEDRDRRVTKKKWYKKSKGLKDFEKAFCTTCLILQTLVIVF